VGSISDRRLRDHDVYVAVRLERCAAGKALARTDIRFLIGRAIGRHSLDALSQVLLHCATIDAMLPTPSATGG